MATPTNPQIALKRRLLRPLPTPGAGKRVRAQKQAQPVGAVDSNMVPASSEPQNKSDLSEDNLATPKASTRDLPPPAEASTPKVPVIQLNDTPLPEISDVETPFVIDEAKDAELREKFLKLQLHEPPKPIIPKLKIPKKPKAPPRSIQRRMARVKPTVKSAPRPEISFGTTVTTFGAETEKPEKEAAGKDAEAAPVNLKALKRRQDREKRERLGISRTKRQLPSFSLPNPSEDEEEDTRTTKGNDAHDAEEDLEEKRQKAKEKMKQVTLFLARDIQKWRIPKKKLKEMAKGKTEEETAARRRVLEMAWKIAKRQQQKEKEKTKDGDKGKEKETVEDSADEGPKEDDAEAEVPNLDEPKVDEKEESEKEEKRLKEKKSAKAEARRKAKGKERAPGWSSAPTEKASK